MFAAPDRRVGDREVHVIGHGDVHRVDLVALFFKQLAPIRIQPGVRYKLGRRFQMPRVQVAQRDDLGPFVLLKVLQVVAAHPRDADAGVAQLAVG